MPPTRVATTGFPWAMASAIIQPRQDTNSTEVFGCGALIRDSVRRCLREERASLPTKPRLIGVKFKSALGHITPPPAKRVRLFSFIRPRKVKFRQRIQVA